MNDIVWLWIGFNLFVLGMLALDLGVFHRKAHAVQLREAIAWSSVWVVLALCFNLGVWHFAGPEKALEFFTGYLIEKSLSVDNLFVFALLFTYFAVPAQYQHKLLFWGILGALIMRAIMIGLGAILITKFAWIIYLFGAFLILTGIKMILKNEEEIHPERNPILRLFRRIVPITADYHQDRFFVRQNGILYGTPLLVALVCVELTDVVFAVDSIPAIFAITTDPFIVYTSNIFAILGLRSLYFVLAGMMHKFHLLKPALGIILAFVGVKMLLAHSAWKIPTGLALGFVAAILAFSVVASLATQNSQALKSAPGAAGVRPVPFPREDQ